MSDFDKGEDAHAQFEDRENARAAAVKGGNTPGESLTCPVCGDEYRNLPKHLPCDGGDGR